MKKCSLGFLFVSVLLSLVFVLTGCNGGGKTTAPVTTTAAPPTTTSAIKTTAPTTTSSGPAPTTSAPTSTALTPQKGGILNIITPNIPNIFGYPVKNTGFATAFVNQACLEAFIDADINGNIRPKLATSWVIAADKSSTTFTLRKGVKFHDGTDFNATAAKWNLDLFLTKGTGSPADWKSVEVVDDYTVRINYKTFKNTQLSNMTYTMISPAAVQKNGVDWATVHAIGTGPFQFKEFVPNTSLEYTRFDGYWGDKAYVDGIKYIFISNATTAAMAFQAGDAQVWESADPKTAYDTMQKTPGYKEETRRGAMMILVPDSANSASPFYNIDVRKAVEFAIDKAAIAKSLGFGTWEALDQPNVPEQFGHIDLTDPRNYNVSRAKQLLAQAGYPNGFSTTLITSSDLPNDPLIAVQGYLAAIGIKANIDVQSAAKWADTRTSGWNNGLFYVTNGATDYNYCAYLERYFTPTSTSAYKNFAYPPDWMTTVNAMMVSSDPAVMKSYAQQLVKILVENASVTPLYVRSEVYLMSTKVHDMGVGTHGDGFSWNPNKVWLSK
jgi:peptide/nickel transport system substrate-binding protein